MRNLKTTLIAALLGAAAIPFLPMDAEAACCTDYAKVQTVEKEGENVINTLTERINAMQLAIIEAMRLGTGQTSGNLKEQIAADSNIANVQDDRSVVGRTEAARFEALRESASASTGCNVMTGARNSASLDSIAGDSARTTSKQMMEYLTGAPGSASADGADVGLNKKLTTSCQLYGSAADVKSNLCAQEGKLPDASIDAGQSLFYKAPGSSVLALDEERNKAAEMFITNVVTPIPMGPLQKGEGATPAGREKAAFRQGNAGRASLAAFALNDIRSRSQALDASEAQAWAKTTTTKIAGYNGQFKDGISWADYMNISARSWWFNPSAGAASNGQGLATAMKDIYHVESFQAYLGWETYQLIEKQNSILSGMLAIMTEQTRNQRVAGR
jgi:hypothetical protein